MTKEHSIDLTFIEPGAHPRTGFPLTVGVPFARGVLPADVPVSIHDASDEPRPVQARVMETHDDGSARWLLLDYQADSRPLKPSTSTLVLNDNPVEVPREHRIETYEQDNALVVENGVLRLALDRTRCRPLARVEHEGVLVTEGGIAFEVVSDGGASFHADADSRMTFEIEESGPLRLLARWEGTHRDETGDGHLDFLVRLTVYADQPVRARRSHVHQSDGRAGGAGQPTHRERPPELRRRADLSVRRQRRARVRSHRIDRAGSRRGDRPDAVSRRDRRRRGVEAGDDAQQHQAHQRLGPLSAGRTAASWSRVDGSGRTIPRRSRSVPDRSTIT